MKATTKSKRKKRAPRTGKERRFEPEQTQSSKLTVGVGMLGALVLGAGVYAQWIREPGLSYAPYLVAVGALVFGVALWFSDAGAFPVRVGDAGVAVEKGSDVTRLAWCDIETIRVDKTQLVLDGEELTLTIPTSSHPTAAAWILKEGMRRVPDAMDVRPRDAERFPEPKESDGSQEVVEAVQVAGRRCAESDKLISYEKDARLCPNCAEVYHKSHVPKRCATCDTEIAGRAFAI